jgi:hypothetical protein
MVTEKGDPFTSVPINKIEICSWGPSAEMLWLTREMRLPWHDDSCMVWWKNDAFEKKT